MQTLSVTPDQMANIAAQVGYLGSSAIYDPHTGILTFGDEVAPAIIAANGDQSAGLKARLRNHAAAVRYDKEVAGVTIDGKTYPSDRESQGKFTSAAVMAQLNPSAAFNWKLADGEFVALAGPQILAVAGTIGAYVGRCFDRENSIRASIEAGTVTTTTDIDTAFAVI